MNTINRTDLDPITEFRDQYRFLSNFWKCSVHIGLVTFPSAEHAYQASKSSNPKIWHKYMADISPAQAKRLGKYIPMRHDFDERKIDFMTEIVEAKFYLNEGLKKLLLQTGDRELIEGNCWGDTFWGVCNGVGQNHLGRILMQVRHDLRIEN